MPCFLFILVPTQCPEWCYGALGAAVNTQWWQGTCQWLQMLALAVPQFSPTLPKLPGYSGHKALECPPPGKWCPIYHHLSLIVSGLEDTPQEAVLHGAIMLAYVFHGLWPSTATAIFSFLVKVWQALRLSRVFFLFFVFFFPPLNTTIGRCLVWSGQDELGVSRMNRELLSKAGHLMIMPLVLDPSECVGSEWNTNCYQQTSWISG